MNTSHFTAVVRGALAQSGFAPPARDESRAIVFACEPLSAQAPFVGELLDAGEAGRAARFRFAHDRTRYILAHAVWRVVLSTCLDVVPARVPLVATPAGQPTLPGTEFSTSLSHAGDWVAVAVCGGAITGIDIEQQPSRVRLTDMADAVCTPAETARVMALASAARELALLELWTRKEALLKAFGVGLGVDPAGFDASTAEPVAPPAAAAGLPCCQVRVLDLPAGLVGALAIPVGVGRISQHRLEWG